MTPASGRRAIRSSSPSTNIRFASDARTQLYETPRRTRDCSHFPRGSSFASSPNLSANRSMRESGASFCIAHHLPHLPGSLLHADWRPTRLTNGSPHPIFAAVRRGNVPMSLEFSADALKKIEALGERYPTKKPVVMAALHLAQKEFGHLSDDALKLVAATLDLPYAHVYGVATFYTMYRRQPGGTQTIRMCTKISCMLRGGYER